MEDKIFDKLEKIEQALLRIAEALEDSNSLNEKIERRQINSKIKEQQIQKRQARKGQKLPNKIRLDQDLNQ